MPIEFTPPRRMLDAFLRLRARMRGADGGPNMGPHLTVETVDAVNSNGTYQVRGADVSATGLAQLEAGQGVTVAWSQGKPNAVVSHQVQRAQFPQILPPTGAPLVEELFIANRTTDGLADVFFRNFDQCRPLLMDSFGISPGTLSTIKWGPANDRFILQADKYYVFKFKRQPQTPFSAGVNAAKELTLEQAITPSASTLPLATVAAVNQQTPTSFTLSLASPGPQTFGFIGVPGSFLASVFVTDFFLDDAGNACFLVQMGVTGGQVATMDGPSQILLQPNLSWTHQIVVDLTRKKVLFTTWDTGASQFAALQQGDIFNAQDGAHWPATIVHLGGGVDCLTPTIYIFQHYFIAPILITAANGVVSWAGVEVRNIQTTQFQTGPPNCPSGVIATSGAMVQPPPPPPPPGSPLVPALPIVLLPMAVGVAGLNFASTYDHIVWRMTQDHALDAYDLNQGGADSAGMITSFKDGSTTTFTAGLRVAFGQHGINVLPSDFVYQLDNPATPFADPKAKMDYFVKAWQFRGKVSPALNVDVGKYPEDPLLVAFKALAPIPKGVVQPHNLGLYALQIVNATSTLSVPGEFQKIPGT